MAETDGSGRPELRGPIRVPDGPELARLAGFAVAAPVTAMVVAVVMAAGLWLGVHGLFPLARAVPCGVSIGAVTGASVASLGVRAGLARRSALAAVCGLWAAVLVGWFTAAFTDPVTENLAPHNRWWLAAALGAFASVGVPGALLVWRQRIPRRYRWWALPAGVTAAVLILPIVAAYWLWNASAHFGTAGEPGPSDAVNAWVQDVFIIGRATPGADIGRLECSEPTARRQMDSYVDSWHPYLARNKWNVTADWDTGRVIRSGGHVVVVGTLTIHVIVRGGYFVDAPSRLRFPVTHSWDGWRVCGVTAASSRVPRHAASPTPAPNPAPPSASPSPSAAPGVLTPPTDMLPCGADDPYRSMGWYTCPPTPTPSG